MVSVGLEELRQNASEIVRRVETVTITVSGRPAAVAVGTITKSALRAFCRNCYVTWCPMRSSLVQERRFLSQTHLPVPRN
ncbi:MAG: type II toxin-antitoxin system Phd/YefM family antitoxin [Pseudonocardiaceae bacterium]